MARTWADALADLPECQPDDVVGDRDVLVIAPHPDDESLGCGGLLAWAVQGGRKPRVLFLTNGEASHPGSAIYPPERLSAIRQKEAVNACAALGMKADSLNFLRYTDSGLSSLQTTSNAILVDAVACWIKRSPRSAVFVTADTDPHSDHVTAFYIAKAATALCADCSLFAYPVWTWVRTENASGQGIRGVRMDIAPFLSAKRAAIACYASQFGNLIVDSDKPFVLPERLLTRMNQDYEVALDVHL